LKGVYDLHGSDLAIRSPLWNRRLIPRRRDHLCQLLNLLVLSLIDLMLGLSKLGNHLRDLLNRALHLVNLG